MKITAYVPCRNGERFLPDVLPALHHQTRKADQYLFIDDRSTDRSVEIAQQCGFEVKHTGPEHFGLAAGRNLALANATGDILVGVDADAVAEPTFLAEVEKVFAQRPEIVGLCGCLNEKYANDTIFDFWRSVHIRQHWGDAERHDPPVLYGSSSAHRSETLRKVGGWNNRFQTNYEDVDLTSRIRASGGRTLYTPACRLWHLKRDTLESLLRNTWNWTFYPSDLSGRYDSLDRWAQECLPWIWESFRKHRLQDLAAPQGAFITCLMPWSMIVRDLHHLYSRRGYSVDLDAIGQLAQNVLVRFGAHAGVAVWVRNWLHDLQTSLPPLQGPAAVWDRRLLQEIETAALLSVPDGGYWSAVHAAFDINH